MNEDQITEELAKKTEVTSSVPSNPIGSPYPEPPKSDEAFHDNLPLENTLENIKLFDYFEIPSGVRRTPEASTYLSRIIDWARDEAKSSEYTDILRVISDQERVLGTKLRPDRLSKMYQFVTINTQRKKLADQERALHYG